MDPDKPNTTNAPTTVTRRKLLTAASTTAAVSVAGCVDGAIVDTDHGCSVNEPQDVPSASQPIIGDEDAEVNILITQDLSVRPWNQFMEHSLKPIISDYVEPGIANIEFYDLALQMNSEWAFQLSSVGRYIHAEAGKEAYSEYLHSINEAYQRDTNMWQAVGDIASDLGLDSCTTIAHGSWKTYEEESMDNRTQMRSNDITQVPTVFVNNRRIVDMTPVERAHNPISDRIDEIVS